MDAFSVRMTVAADILVALLVVVSVFFQYRRLKSGASKKK